MPTLDNGSIDPKLQLVMAELLQGSLEAADELGEDLSPILEEQGIDRSVLESPEGFLRVQVRSRSAAGAALAEPAPGGSQHS